MFATCAEDHKAHSSRSIWTSRTTRRGPGSCRGHAWGRGWWPGRGRSTTAARSRSRPAARRYCRDQSEVRTAVSLSQSQLTCSAPWPPPARRSPPGWSAQTASGGWSSAAGSLKWNMFRLYCLSSFLHVLLSPAYFMISCHLEWRKYSYSRYHK